MLTLSAHVGSHDWTLMIQDEKDPKSEWRTIAQCLGLPVPAKGDIVFHEDVNGPLEVVERVWGLHEGYPLTCEVHARLSKYPEEKFL